MYDDIECYLCGRPIRESRLFVCPESGQAEHRECHNGDSWCVADEAEVLAE